MSDFIARYAAARKAAIARDFAKLTLNSAAAC